MNKKLFKMYCDSESGRNTINLFNPETEDVFSSIESLIKYANQELGCKFNKDSFCDLVDVLWENFSAKGVWAGELSRNTYSDFIENFEIEVPEYDDAGNAVFTSDTKMVVIKKDNYRKKASLTPFLSILLYYQIDFFKPMLLVQNHDIFQRNCAILGIDLPPIPRTNDHRAYCLHYFDICEAINEFQKGNGLSDAETCAAIYDFASNFSEDQSTLELPSPTNVWLTGAASSDFKFLDNMDDGASSIWACNERTRRGDIVVIYATTPRSYIHSVWRADSVGIFNPFDYYHCRTHVRDGVKVPPITFNDLKTDSYFSQVPIIRKNLQGVNGWELTAKDYSELLRMIEERGGDTSVLPHLFDGSSVDFGTIQNEHDVEENILIPALHKLGYTDADWTRQLSLKAGRKEKAIPDFVFFARGECHFEHAPMVIEAKHDMSSMTEMQNAFRQGLSYARMLRASLMAICDKERIIVYQVDINGSSDQNNPVYENHWAKIFSDETEGAKLKQIIGRECVFSL